MLASPPFTSETELTPVATFGKNAERVSFIGNGRMADYTLADIAPILGVKRRTAQLWAEAGVLQPIAGTDRAGTGTHRRFGRDEAIIGCIVAALSSRTQAPIGVAIRIAKFLREGMKHKRARETFDRAVNGDAQVYLIFRFSGSPRFVLQLADDSIDDQISLAVVVDDGSRAEEELMKDIGSAVASELKNERAYTAVILLNSYVGGIR